MEHPVSNAETYCALVKAANISARFRFSYHRSRKCHGSVLSAYRRAKYSVPSVSVIGTEPRTVAATAPEPKRAGPRRDGQTDPARSGSHRKQPRGACVRAAAD